MSESETPGDRRKTGWALGSLLFVYLLVHVLIVANAVSAARDGKRYLEFAARLQSKPCLEVLRSEEDHPAYPMLLAATFALLSIEEPGARMLTAQILSSLFGAIVALIAFRIALRYWGLLSAWSAAMAFIVLPRPAWIFSDILSDSLYAAFWIAATHSILMGLETKRLRYFFSAGLLSTFAYFTRIEALTLPAAVCISLLLMALRPQWRRDWGLKRIGAAGTCYGVTILVGFVTFLCIYGSLSPKPSYQNFFPTEPSTAIDLGLASGMHFLATIEIDGDLSWPRAIWSVVRLIAQQVQGFHLVPLVIALVFSVSRGKNSLTVHFLWCLMMVYFAILALTLKRVGYIDGRYFLAAVPVLVIIGSSAIVPTHRWLRENLKHCKTLPLGAIAFLFVFGSVAGSLPSLLKRNLHQNLQGVMQAGAWIAANTESSATVFDSYYFPTYASGIGNRVTNSAIPDGTTTHYVIAQDRDLGSMPELSKLIREKKAESVAEFERSPGSIDRVQVYRIARDVSK